jgi:hypothetical protein
VHGDFIANAAVAAGAGDGCGLGAEAAGSGACEEGLKGQRQIGFGAWHQAGQPAQNCLSQEQQQQEQEQQEQEKKNHYYCCLKIDV